MSSLTIALVARSINKAVTGITIWRISAHPEGKVAELTGGEGLVPLATIPASAVMPPMRDKPFGNLLRARTLTVGCVLARGRPVD